ncbi:MAG: hypothetical protein LBQ58_10805 [Synergistaceae bacterium]|jgi:hypothetical protein|nr:hypothetical protein [Synergistaceae bacterium]
MGPPVEPEDDREVEPEDDRESEPEDDRGCAFKTQSPGSWSGLDPVILWLDQRIQP